MAHLWVENYSETTAKGYYSGVINYLEGPGGSNVSVNMKSAHKERVNCLPPVCKCEGSVAPCWAQLLAQEGQLHMQLKAHTL